MPNCAFTGQLDGKPLSHARPFIPPSSRTTPCPYLPWHVPGLSCSFFLPGEKGGRSSSGFLDARSANSWVTSEPECGLLAVGRPACVGCLARVGDESNLFGGGYHGSNFDSFSVTDLILVSPPLPVTRRKLAIVRASSLCSGHVSFSLSHSQVRTTHR